MNEGMDLAHLRTGELAGIHGAITALSVNVGVLSAQMKALDEKVVHHMTFEHKDFEETNETVTEIQKNVAAIQAILNQQRGAWLALAKVAGVIVLLVGALAWIIDNIGKWPRVDPSASVPAAQEQRK